MCNSLSLRAAAPGIVQSQKLTTAFEPPNRLPPHVISGTNACIALNSVSQ